MFAVSKNHELTELCNTVLKEVNNSSMWSVINDPVRKRATDNVLYIEQLVDGMHKLNKSAPVSLPDILLRSIAYPKLTLRTFSLRTESPVKKNLLCTHASTEKLLSVPKYYIGHQVKDPKDNAEPHKADCEAHQPGQSSHSNSVPPVSVDMDTVMANMAKNINHMEVHDHAHTEPSHQGLHGQCSIPSYQGP
ncbi:hypothetical protein Moror_15793 [Moniliophthora roreri MCA 2997]|uniref:Uncharacterized protein n=1 Tax=Moniliophthora roreri (strain MCA 2997) TaxID=1381753 RepID=V2XMZ6_MONRO|nr:hypothetical protein Moror_15793 [Moniliophthora roreri MCA 2997]